jgi:hypothetical protein
MATQMIRRQRHASPERWRKAVERALSEGIQVRQLAGSGAWIATSGSDASTAYEIAVTGSVAHGCECLAGINGDAVCKHRAAFYLAIGLLDPEPAGPAPGPALIPCTGCVGSGQRQVRVVSPLFDSLSVRCGRCQGAGVVEEGPAPIAA